MIARQVDITIPCRDEIELHSYDPIMGAPGPCRVAFEVLGRRLIAVGQCIGLSWSMPEEPGWYLYSDRIYPTGKLELTLHFMANVIEDK